MKLIKLNCPNCGSKLEVNDELKTFTCNYCGNNILLDDEVIHVEHKVAGEDKEKLFHNAFVLLDSNEFMKAEKLLEELEMNYPDDSRVHEGYIRIYTKNFNKNILPSGEIIFKMNKSLDNYMKFSNKKDDKFIKDFSNYSNDININLQKQKRSNVLKKTAMVVGLIITLILIIVVISEIIES